MTIQIFLKSGTAFTVKCDEFEHKTNGLGALTSYSIKGITENKPVYLDISQVAAVVRVLSDKVD